MTGFYYFDATAIDMREGVAAEAVSALKTFLCYRISGDRLISIPVAPSVIVDG
ncbi:hypothetical protein [Microcoleus sp. T3_A4]|uniref:hypothetical protein n=1 Tax=Microcoleus sp. T3_A4 TaxID=2818968 RepID=UPI002FD02047